MELEALIRFYSETGKAIFNGYIDLGRPILDWMHVIFNNLFYFILFITIFFSAIYYMMSIYSITHRKKYAEKEFILEKAPTVTVQIPTMNELAAIRCAKKCLEFDYPKNKFEIVIGDDSTDKKVSAELRKLEAAHDQIHVFKRKNNDGYKAGNLNNMLKHSKGDILVLFDSDFVPEKDFLKRIVTPFIYNPKVSGVQARWKFLDQNRNFVTVLGSTIVTVFHQICLPFINKNVGISFLCGSAEAVRKKELISMGGWKSGSLTEDIEYSIRLLKEGKKIIYLDGLECYGEVPSKAKDLYRQQMRWAYGVIYSFKDEWKSLFKSKKITFKEKFFVSFFCSGYLLSFLLLLLFAFGSLSFITHTPAPIDFARFFSEMGRNVLLTSGILLASCFAMIKAKNVKKMFHMLISSFSYGIIVTYYVNMGIFKVLFNRPMRWYLLTKDGNKLHA